MEKHLEQLMATEGSSQRTSQSLSNAHNNGDSTQYGIQYQNRDGDESVIWGAGGKAHLPGTPRQSGMFGQSPSLNGFGSINGRESMNGREFGASVNGREGKEGQGHGTGTPNMAHWGDADLEEKALSMAIEEVWEEDTSERKLRPWAANGRSCRVGEVRLSSFLSSFPSSSFPSILSCEE